MNNVNRYAFINAKIHGIYARSFLGDNFHKLASISNLKELSSHLFPDIKTVAINTSLHRFLQQKVFDYIHNQISLVFKYFEKQQILLKRIIGRFEIDNLKQIIRIYNSEYLEKPFFYDIKDYFEIDKKILQTLDLTKKENLFLLFKNTKYEFINELIMQNKSIFEIENKIDIFYYQQLINGLKGLNRIEKKVLKSLIIQEINWQNITWAFRLKQFYAESFENSSQYFINQKLALPVELFSDIFFYSGEMDFKKIFKKWPSFYTDKIISVLDEYGEVKIHKLESIASEYINQKYYHLFYTNPFTLLPLVAFIYLKRKELNSIIALIEALRYNISKEILYKSLGY